MRALLAAGVALVALTSAVHARQFTRTLVAVLAHADDETPMGPVLARYAREGVQVHLIVATDGAQGAANTTIPRGPELAAARGEEARCSAQALGARPPILLGFPDGALGHYSADPALLLRLTQRLVEELQRLQPDAIVTWGPDGGYGHPDHRIISSVVTQLARAGAPGMPQRVFYASIPEEGFRAMNPARGAPPFVIPRPDLFTVRVPFAPEDLDAARRSMACHKTQFPDDVVQRVTGAMREIWKGTLPFTPMQPQVGGTDLFE
jgi:LmbE family N-acetylglucosaminyl deacetylase